MNKTGKTTRIALIVVGTIGISIFVARKFLSKKEESTITIHDGMSWDDDSMNDLSERVSDLEIKSASNMESTEDVPNPNRYPYNKVVNASPNEGTSISEAFADRISDSASLVEQINSGVHGELKSMDDKIREQAKKLESMEETELAQIPYSPEEDVRHDDDEGEEIPEVGSDDLVESNGIMVDMSKEPTFGEIMIGEFEANKSFEKITCIYYASEDVLYDGTEELIPEVSIGEKLYEKLKNDVEVEGIMYVRNYFDKADYLITKARSVPESQ